MAEPTIQLNNRPYPWREGATIAAVMAENNYDFNQIVVKKNGKIIEEEKWQETEISAGDEVEMIHLFGGG